MLVYNPCANFLLLLPAIVSQLKGPLVGILTDNDTDFNLLSCFLQIISSQKPVIIQNIYTTEWGQKPLNNVLNTTWKKHSNLYLQKPSSNVVFLRELSERLEMFELWNNLGDVLVVTTNQTCIDEILQHIWLRQCPGLTIMLLEEGNVEFYTKFPYGEDDARKLDLNQSVFPNKYPLQFNGYPLLILSDNVLPLVTDKNTGVEEKILETVCRQLNLSRHDLFQEDPALSTKDTEYMTSVRKFMLYRSFRANDVSLPHWALHFVVERQFSVLSGTVQYF